MKKILPLIIIITTACIGYYLIRSRIQSVQQVAVVPVATEVPSSTSINCIPTFRDGGGPYYQFNSPFRNNLAPESTTGEKLAVSGKVLSQDCTTPLANVIVDIWQANESGSYEDEWYRGRVTTNAQGEYSFTTIVPKGYGEGTGFRPPHIHFKIWQYDQELITSQMFFPASRSQGIEDAYIINVETKQENGVIEHIGMHNIIVP